MPRFTRIAAPQVPSLPSFARRMSPVAEFGVGLGLLAAPILEPVTEVATDVAGIAMMTDALRRRGRPAKRAAPLLSTAPLGLPPPGKRAALLQAHAWTCYGYAGTSDKAMAAILSGLLRKPIAENNAFEVYWLLHQKYQGVILQALQALYGHRLLPAQRAGTVRVHHSLLKGPPINLATIDAALHEGLRAQPTTTGRFSEHPWALAAATEAPNAARDGGTRYAIDAPWITADVPIAWDGWERSDIGQHGRDFVDQQGAYALFIEVPREFIVGVNGVPVEDFVRSRYWLRETPWNCGYEEVDRLWMALREGRIR